MSIRWKVALAAVLCTLVGGALILYFLQMSYQESVDLGAETAISTAKQQFETIKQGDIAKLSSTMDALMADEHIQETFLNGDREALLAETAPLFKELKEDYSMTHWYFVRPEPELNVLLRVHSPDEFDDQLTRKTFTNAVDTGAQVADLEFGSRMTYSLHVAAPWYNEAGEIIGYMNVGEETNHFFETMKERTGDDYWLLVNKEGVDQEKWAARRVKDEAEDTWSLHENLLLITWTKDEAGSSQWEGDPAALATEGEVLDEVREDDRVYVRGVFPISDVNGMQSGAVVVKHDITGLYDATQQSQTRVMIAVGALILLIPLVIILVLNSTVVKPLEQMLGEVETLQTRVAGGDFSFEPKAVKSNDEIGRFKKQFNGFMKMVADVLKQQIGG